MSEQVGSATHKKSSDFHGGIRFQSSFTIRWELEDKTNIVCLDDSLKYRIMAIKTNENFIPFSNNVTFRKPRGTDLVTASELIPGFCRSKSNGPTPGSLHTIKSPTAGIVLGIKSPPPPPPPMGFTLIGALDSAKKMESVTPDYRTTGLRNAEYAIYCLYAPISCYNWCVENRL